MFHSDRVFLIALLIAPAVLLAGEAKSAKPPLDFQVDPYGQSDARTFEVVPGKKSPWSFTIEPYGWTPGLSGDVGVHGFGPVHLDIDTISVLRALKWAAFAKAEVRYGRWGILSDGFFVDLEADSDTPGPLYKNATVTVQQGLAQLALAYRVWEDRRGFVDLYAGARYNYLGVNIAAAKDSAGIEQVGDKSTDFIFEKLSARARSAVQPRVEALSDRLDAGLAQSRAAASTKLGELQRQIEQAIRQGANAEISQLQEQQAQVSATLQQQVTTAVQQVESVRNEALGAVKQEVGSRAVEKWAKFPRSVQKLLKQRALQGLASPNRQEFVTLAQAQIEQRVAVAKAEIARQLQAQLVEAAQQRFDAAKQVLAETLKSKASAVRQQRDAARRLVGSSRSQLASAQQQLDGISVDTSKLDQKVAQAKKKLAKAITDGLDEKLPNGASGDRWWVDPFVGIRAQVNLTRWLFLATQCDVGGFGAGSQIAWNLNGSLGINWTRNIFTETGWRYYYVDYENGGLIYKVAESGLFVGAGLKF